MSDSECPSNIRSELIANCRRSKCRTSAFTPESPTKWRPTTVIDPTDAEGRAFTDSTAWEYVATLLEQNVDVEVIILTKPRGKKAFVMKVQAPQGEIYIKLQLGPPGVKGRSFHYSEYSGR
ncbi:hypothetical protein PQR25_04630 [Paraburkholderia nemoris]|uniref:hypothetical protein n=1 Tax=Paraburkholderia nemoris TaxID=2793076 RepID=UPI0038B7DDD7